MSSEKADPHGKPIAFIMARNANIAWMMGVVQIVTTDAMANDIWCFGFWFFDNDEREAVEGRFTEKQVSILVFTVFFRV